MADPKAPETAEAILRSICPLIPGQYLQHIADLLSAHGLAIVSEADRKVIEACAANEPGEHTWLDSWCEPVWQAELEARKTRAK